ncbi:hypothetical protein PLICRDRAFT_425757 [Plicaturopsis crispa FD-325 SS-3]|nr:hypothetical protein PLICRDRAFT_425757 [Plicaturopsis crispa FD-325 SS-3]
MFFTPELLSRRDSGFGLLWLAATLGSKSTFKKLPKRSVLTADIAQLCDLIAEPAEPLALRLSSNLMVGVARVYKVKQEIFMTDVTTCFNSLKKVVQDIRMSTTDAQLLMAQPSVKSGALTLAADPNGRAMDFDNLVADWDEYLNMDENTLSDEDFNPDAKKGKKQKGKAKVLPFAENLRADLHTLQEHHDHLLSASYDASFNINGGPSSSQADALGSYAFDDNFFGSDGLDLGGGFGDELARELGEGWGSAPLGNENQMDVDMDMNMPMGDVDIGIDFDLGGTDLDGQIAANAFNNATPYKFVGSDKENLPPSSIPPSDLTALTPVSFSQQLLSQDVPRAESTVGVPDNDQPQPDKKKKRVRLLLDSRTELTDEELKAARSQYLEGQDALRRDMALKKTEKESGKIIEDMIWGAPEGLQAQDLIDFWSANFKVQVEARSGAVVIDSSVEPPKKRRKIRDRSPAVDEERNEVDMAYEMDMGGGMDHGMEDGLDGNFMDRLRSSEEPGQARRVSRPTSALGSQFGYEPVGTQEVQGSQRSSLFPWDHAGASSSDGAAFDIPGSGSARISIDRAEVRLRRSRSGSRRASSIVPSHIGSGMGGVAFSPATLGKGSQLDGEDFVFDVPGEGDKSVNLESQQSDVNLITLERNSFNFLEYAKMQSQILPNSTSLVFDHVVPQATSTRHVAAAGFYHCLVLATKDLIHLSQPAAYGTVTITIS